MHAVVLKAGFIVCFIFYGLIGGEKINEGQIIFLSQFFDDFAVKFQKMCIRDRRKISAIAETLREGKGEGK